MISYMPYIKKQHQIIFKENNYHTLRDHYLKSKAGEKPIIPGGINFNAWAEQSKHKSGDSQLHLITQSII